MIEKTEYFSIAQQAIHRTGTPLPTVARRVPEEHAKIRVALFLRQRLFRAIYVSSSLRVPEQTRDQSSLKI